MPVIACLVTGEARAAIATICLSGPRASLVIEQNFTAATNKPLVASEVRYGKWHGGELVSEANDRSESVVVVRMDTQNRDIVDGRWFYPLDCDAWEIHCHGGMAATKRIVEDLKRTGATILGPSDWQFACGINRLEQEASETLARTTTTRTAAIVLDQVRGAFCRWVDEMLTQVESSSDIGAVQARIRHTLDLASFGLHLTEPWKVVLAGAPNVGKSSLINSLVGYRRSITLDQPGTTRDVLQAHAVIDGWPILFSDTAGIRDNPAEEIEREGISRTNATVRSADLVIWVVDGTQMPEADDRSRIELSRDFVRVINKIDLCESKQLRHSRVGIETSATTGVGIDELRQTIVSKLLPVIPEAGTAIPVCERQVAWLTEAAAAKDLATVRLALQKLQGK